MEQEQSRKLTDRLRSGYDRSMSETGAAVLEKPSEEEKLFEKWKPQLEKAGTDTNLRDAIMSAIRNGEEPRGELGQEELRKMSEKEVNKRFREMTQKPEIRSGDDLYKIDRILDTLSDRVKGAMGELGDDSVPPGEILRELPSWEKFGWSEGDPARDIKSDREKVEENLLDVFNGEGGIKIDDKQAKIMVEIFLSEGKKPADLTKEKLDEKRRSIMGAWQDNNTQHNNHNTFDIFLMKELGIEEIMVKHFILPLDVRYVQQNDQEIDYSPPKNIEELAWQMMHTPGKQYRGWGVKGDFPLLEMRVEPERDEVTGEPKTDANGNFVIDKEKSRYRVNTANMVRWARYNMYTAYDLDRETPHNFFQEIALKKRYPLSLQEMLLNPKQYFVSEDGISYDQLLLEWYKEAAVFTTVRSWDCAYRGVAGDPDELSKVFKEIYNTQNLLTRGALGSNIINLMTTMPLDFEGTKEGHWPSDGKMGAAWIDIYRAYDSMIDFDNLKNVLGAGSKFFTQKGWEEAIGEVAKENIAATGVDKIRVFTKKEFYEYFEGAFDEKGEISSEENKKKFIKLINIFGPKMIGGKVEWSVRAALRSAIAEKYGSEVYVYQAKPGPNGERVPKLDANGNKIKKHAFIANQGEKGVRIEDRVEDSDSLKIAEAIAWSLAKPFGAGAKNDSDGVGHDWMARVYNTQLMRQKYPGRGDKFGNEYSMMQFKRTGMDPLNGIVTEAYTNVLDENGQMTYKKKKDGSYEIKNGKRVPITREKTIMEVMIELSAYKTASANKLKEYEKQIEELDEVKDADKIKKIRAAILAHNKKYDQEYQNKAQQMSFGQRTLSNYWEDHLKNGIDLYRQLVSAKEISFEKFTEYDAYGGVRFKQEEFQKEVQDEWIHKIRYMIDTYPSLNFNMKVRILDQTKTAHNNWRKGLKSEPVYHDVYLGEAMFGHEMLNRPVFWKKDKNGKPINKINEKGRKIKGVYEIDYQKVQDNKQQVWKQWFMMKLAADLYSHKALHANEHRFNFTYYKNVVEAISKIPKEINQDEYGFKDISIHKYFFDRADIKWLQKESKTTNFSLYSRAIFKDLSALEDPQEGIGLLAMLAIFSGQIIKSESR